MSQAKDGRRVNTAADVRAEGDTSPPSRRKGSTETAASGRGANTPAPRCCCISRCGAGLSTESRLLAQYGTSAIPLARIAQDLLGLSPDKAARQARLCQLALSPFRLGSQKAPWLVHVSDLAAYIDREREAAADEWRRVNGRATKVQRDVH